MKPITAYLPSSDNAWTETTVEQLKSSGAVERIVLLTRKGKAGVSGCETMQVDSLRDSDTVRSMVLNATTPYFLLILQENGVALGPQAVERIGSVAASSGSPFVYADY
jgi:hypothetical protein